MILTFSIFNLPTMIYMLKLTAEDPLIAGDSIFLPAIPYLVLVMDYYMATAQNFFYHPLPESF